MYDLSDLSAWVNSLDWDLGAVLEEVANHINIEIVWPRS